MSSILRSAAIALLLAASASPAWAGKKGKGAAYPTEWVVSNPEAASETETVRDLATRRFPDYQVRDIAFSSDWKNLRHRDSGALVGRQSRALVVLFEEAEDRCLLVELQIRQERGASAGGWGPSTLGGDHLQVRPASEVPKVRRIGKDKSWWAVTLAECPAAQAAAP
ncbi:hypothetical protein L6R50_02865 [Myxococcota bacterium]|nr:hypothetical protein [Myxococcota bacterium]